MKIQEGYATGCDGTPLFYRTCGQGPDMLACNGIGVSTFFWRRFEKHFSSRFRFITWDYRGHGRSEPPRDPTRISIETLADDLNLVARHLDAKKPILFGHSMGVQVILEYYRAFPEWVGALIPVLGSYGRPVDTFMNFKLSRPIFDRMLKFAKTNPAAAERFHRFVFDPAYAVIGAGLLGLIDRLYCPTEAMREYFQHISSLNTQMLLDMGQSMADHTTRDILQTINVPTLIIAGEKDLLTPIQLSFEMQRLIPGAELVFIRRGTHTSLIEQPTLIIDRIESFLSSNGLGGARRTANKSSASSATQETQTT